MVLRIDILNHFTSLALQEQQKLQLYSSNNSSNNSSKMSVLATHLLPKHGFSKLSKPSITLLEGLGVEGDCHAGKTVQHLFNIQNEKEKGHAPSPNLRQVHLIQSELFNEEGIYGKSWWGTQRLRSGQMGENITTVGIDLLNLSKGAKLNFVANKTEEERIRRLPSMYDHILLASTMVTAITAIVARPARLWIVPIILILITLLVFRSRFVSGSSDLVETPVAIVRLTGQRKPCGKINKRFGFKKGPGLKGKCMVKDQDGQQCFKAGVMGVVEVGGVVRPGMSIVVESPEVFEKLPGI